MGNREQRNNTVTGNKVDTGVTYVQLWRHPGDGWKVARCLIWVRLVERLLPDGSKLMAHGDQEPGRDETLAAWTKAFNFLRWEKSQNRRVGGGREQTCVQK